MTAITRRAFATAVGSTVIAWPLSALGQRQQQRPIVAWLSSATQVYSAGNLKMFLQGMHDAGYEEGRHFEMVSRYSEGYQDRLPALAEELVQLKPSVILATAVVGAVAAKKVTSTIPIVSPALADAVELGLVANRAHPGGNVTGIEPYVPGLPAKQMEFARELVPGASRVGLLSSSKDQKAPPQVKELESAGRALELKIVTADASVPEEIDGALQSLSTQADVVIVIQTSMFLSQGQRIATSALARRLPTVYGYREHVVAGGLISYGVDLRWCFHRGAYFVDKILKGAKPGDLPVEFPTKMVLSINLKTAKALGINVPPALLGLADEVIE